MATTRVNTPTSFVRFGHAREDITPPVGIYHRMWGAARHDAATGIHRPVFLDVLYLAPRSGVDGEPVVRVLLDFVGLSDTAQNRIRVEVAQAAGVAVDAVIITYSHSHASGVYGENRQSLPGGDLIAPFLEKVRGKAADAAARAAAAAADAVISYATGHCDMAANRDYWDDETAGHVCGHNPDAPADDTLTVARVASTDGTLKAVITHYACHPTTLAWENTLISPDYVGALRETVETATGVPCCFFQGPCGDLGPRNGFVGDVAIADSNGRQVGYAAVSALESLLPAGTDFVYAGPVVSGATLGTWKPEAFAPSRETQVSTYAGGPFTAPLPMKPMPEAAALRKDRERYLEQQKEADAAGDAVRARDLGARAERCHRWLGRLELIPEGSDFPFECTAYRFGDAVWVTVGAEPYNLLQTELRRRFPQTTLLISPLSGNTQVAYLLPRDRYGRGLYQEEPSILAPGCLELLIDAVSDRIEGLTGVARVGDPVE